MAVLYFHSLFIFVITWWTLFDFISGRFVLSKKNIPLFNTRNVLCIQQLLLYKAKSFNASRVRLLVRKSVISNQSSIYFVSNHINSVQYLYISGNSKAHPFRILLLMCNMDRIDYFQKKSTKLQLIWILKVIDYKLITSNFRSNQLHLITFPPCFQNYLWLLLITLPVFGFFPL